MIGVVGLETPSGSLALPAPRKFEREPGRAFPRVRIGHVPLDMGRLDEVLACIERLVAGGQGGHILTPGVEQVVRAEADASLREALATAEALQAFQKGLELAPERQEFRIGFGHFLRRWSTRLMQGEQDPGRRIEHPRDHPPKCRCPHRS